MRLAYHPRVLKLGTLGLLLFAGCSFDPSAKLAGDDTTNDIIDGGRITVDADPNAPDADPSALVEVLLLSSDPFGDGTAVSFIADYDDRLYLGPSANGTKLMRMYYDASNSDPVFMSFPKADAHENSQDGPYLGIGFDGCAENLSCGPHNENLRGFFTSGIIAGREWLILGGAHSGADVDYIYMSETTGTGTAAMNFVDLAGLLGGSSEGISTVQVVDNHTYIGVTDTGSARPYLIDLAITPSGAGVEDPVEGTDVFDLIGKDVPGIGDDNGAPNHAMVDSITEFGERLYAANRHGWTRSGNGLHPQVFGAVPGDYLRVTPDSDDYDDQKSVAPAVSGDILPADRAVPNMVEYKGQLFAARNTENGPQLWSCAGTSSKCDSADWSLVAPNSPVEIQLTQFNNINNSAISLLEATPTHLYVGFDNAVNGVVLYRTDAAAPAQGSDFTGLDGCAAGFSCAGLGGDGFGIPLTNTQFLDSESIDVGDGLFQIFALVGDTTSALNLYRFQPPAL